MTETKSAGNQRWGAEPLRVGGELHIPYVQHYSTLAHTGSYGSEPFQPFNTNGLTDSKTSEHLCWILSVLWGTGRWRESKGERQKNRTELGMIQQRWNRQSRSLFLCSLVMHDTLISNALIFSMTLLFMVTFCVNLLFLFICQSKMKVTLSIYTAQKSHSLPMH